MLKPESSSLLHLGAAVSAGTLVMLTVLLVPWSFRLAAADGWSSLLTKPCQQKDLGVLLQRMIFHRSDMLPVYGSSELTKPQPTRADHMFRNKPDGFQVCPVGQAGNTTLLMAEKIASVGSPAQGKKVAVLLSPSWFRGDGVPPDHYAGNFSPLQAMRVLQNPGLDESLRHRFAMRMLDFHSTLVDQPLLQTCLQEVADQDSSLMSKLDQLTLRQEANLLRMDDYVSSVLSWAKAQFWTRKRSTTEPELQQAEQNPLAPSLTEARPGDQHFVESFATSKEWQDLDLLLSTLQALHMQVLVITIPLDGAFEEEHGVSVLARNAFYHHIDEICTQHGCRMEHFADHDHDSAFVVEHTSHLSSRGWLFVDHLLDDFYHDRLPVAQTPNT